MAVLQAGIYTGPGMVDDTTFSPSIAGLGIHVLTYTYIDANGCVNQDTATVEVDICAGWTSIQPSEVLKLYPNPFSAMLSLEAENLRQVTIFDVLGKVVLSKKNLSGNMLLLNTKDIPNGMYTVEVRTERGTLFGRL